MKNILWRDYLGSLPKAKKEDIVAIESVLGVKLPEDYINVVIEHQGQSPVKCIVSNDVLEGVPFSPLFHISCDGEHSDFGYGVLCHRKKWFPYYPHLIPFAGTGGGGSVFAFDYENLKTPKVVFIDSDLVPEDPDSVFFVADSFSSLLCDLKGDDELDL